MCAGAVVRDDAGRLLLVRRGRPPARGSWSIPGGKVEPGESHADAAAREVLEETGLRVEVGELLLSTPLFGGYLVHDFAASVIDGTLRAGDDADDVGWFTPAELERLPLTDGLLDELRKIGAL
ncbi:MAG TPA: NUDIX hydrolase [Mycobacteriales bacterium]|nr:NUDIX hydrolase [Mycobacteriales bacterium]